MAVFKFQFSPGFDNGDGLSPIKKTIFVCDGAWSVSNAKFTRRWEGDGEVLFCLSKGFRWH